MREMFARLTPERSASWPIDQPRRSRNQINRALMPTLSPVQIVTPLSVRLHGGGGGTSRSRAVELPVQM